MIGGTLDWQLMPTSARRLSPSSIASRSASVFLADVVDVVVGGTAQQELAVDAEHLVRLT
jgi:hypothetical protein